MSVLDLFRLDGRVAIVTGASSGLGVGFAETLAEAGADVVLGARRVDRLEEVKGKIEALGRRCLAVATDVSKVEDCNHLVDAAVTEFGRVDILVNNAGVGHAAPAHREDPADFNRVLGINLTGAYYMAQAFGRACIDSKHGRLLRVEGRHARHDAGPGDAVVGATRDPGQRPGAELLLLRAHGPAAGRRGRPAEGAVAHPSRTHRRTARARRSALAARVRRRLVHHRDHAAGRWWMDLALDLDICRNT
jgi:NAD(P)-dependent dehydrogenase (short-subunit alcohol dehydrogenase family)